MKLLDMLFGRRAADGRDGLRGHADLTGVPAKSRTPEEAKARRKAYRKRKAAKAARRRRRNRR